MALTNISTGGGVLTSLANDGQAISEIRVQQLVDTDYTKIKSFRAIHKLYNISIGSSVNTLNSMFTVEGEELLIRKSDGTFHEFTVGPLTPAKTIINKVNMTSDSVPFHHVYATGGYGFRAFDNSGTTYADINGAGGYLRFNTELNNPVTITQYYVHNRYVTGFKLQGSTNAVEWTDLDARTVGSNTAGTYAVTTPGAYNWYRLYITSADSTTSSGIYTLHLYVDGNTCDTTAITAGEVPNRVYKMQDTITINETLAVENKAERDYRYGYDGESVKIYADYGTVDFTATREIVTQVDLKQELNQIVEMTGEIYAITYMPANDYHTANNIPNTIGTLAVSGADAASVTDAWKLFDGDWVNDAFTVPTGAAGAIDLVFTYSFVTPTIIYATKIAYNGAAQSMKDFKVEGSNDGTNWDLVYDKVGQGLTVDNLIITKAVDTFGSYLHYRLVITAGATENDNLILKSFTLMTEQTV